MLTEIPYHGFQLDLLHIFGSYFITVLLVLRVVAVAAGHGGLLKQRTRRPIVPLRREEARGRTSLQLVIEHRTAFNSMDQNLVSAPSTGISTARIY